MIEEKDLDWCKNAAMQLFKETQIDKLKQN